MEVHRPKWFMDEQRRKEDGVTRRVPGQGAGLLQAAMSSRLGPNDLETELLAGDGFLKDLQYGVQIFDRNLPRR